MKRLYLAFMLAIVLAACGEDSSVPAGPSEPGTPTAAGTWVGTVPVQGATARMTWTLTHSTATDVSGPVLIGLTSGTVLLNGFLTGSLNGTMLTYTISVGPGGIPLSPTCVGQLGGTMAIAFGATPSMAGDFVVRSSSCPTSLTNGTITLTRQ